MRVCGYGVLGYEGTSVLVMVVVAAVLALISVIGVASHPSFSRTSPPEINY